MYVAKIILEAVEISKLFTASKIKIKTERYLYTTVLVLPRVCLHMKNAFKTAWRSKEKSASCVV